MTVSYAAAGVILLAMVGVSCYAALTLPAGARVPIHFGMSYNNFVPKTFGLIVHPLLGAAVYGIFVAVSRGGAAGTNGKAPAYLVVPIVMCVLLAIQLGAIRVARRQGGR